MVFTFDLMTCPSCGGDLYRSRRQGFIERHVLGMFRMRAFRCHRCRGRFISIPVFVFRSRTKEERDKDEVRKKRRSSRERGDAATETTPNLEPAKVESAVSSDVPR